MHLRGGGEKKQTSLQPGAPRPRWSPPLITQPAEGHQGDRWSCLCCGLGAAASGSCPANGSFGLITGDGDPREQGSGAGQSSTQESSCCPGLPRNGGGGGWGRKGLSDHKALPAPTWTCGFSFCQPKEGGVALVSILKDRKGLAGEGDTEN